MKFSITIPSYKSRFLDEAIKSVVAQTYMDWELIIVDDCSPEDLESIVKPYMDDKRIRFFRNDKNCGVVDLVDNWNICLSHCTGEYVICIGDDDCLLPCCLEEYSRLIDKYPHLNVYHARSEIINEQGEVIHLQEPRPEWESALSLLWNRWAYRTRQFIGDFCYHVQYLKDAGGYYKLPLAWGSDDITAVLAAKEKGIANTQSFCFQYRQNSWSITSSTSHAKMKNQATMAVREWSFGFLKDMAATKHSEEDDKYLQTLEVIRDAYLVLDFGKNTSDYTHGNPFRLMECYQMLRPMHLPKVLFVKWYLSSVYSIFRQKRRT